jgi:hypothetical protein
MRVQRFDVRIAAGPRGHALIVVPFDPDTEWGVKAVHHVSGTVNGCRVRVTLEPGRQRLGVHDEPDENAACGYCGRLTSACGTVA